MLFNIAALGWSAAMILNPHRIDPPQPVEDETTVH